MKKFVSIIFLLVCQQGLLYSATAFSGTTHSENWLLVNFEYGCFFKNPIDPSASADNSFGSFGIGMTFQSYSNWSNWGFYIHPYFLFPATLVSTKTGGLITTEEQVDLVIGLILGPAYRVILGGGAYLHFSVGFYISYINGSYTTFYPGLSGSFKYDLNGVNIGAGGEVGFKYDMSESMHLSFGFVWTLDILSTIFLSDPNRVPPKYLWVTIKPYIGVGMTITAENSWYIKFENEEF